MCTLSIVIPVYNVERYLPKCLDSLLIETSVPYEIILVNDGSTDGSLAVAEDYRARFPERVSVITTENMGQGNARNVGLERAKGEFLYFIDSDDYLAPGGMEGILSCLREDFDICIFDSIAVNADGKELKYMPGFRGEDRQLSLRTHPELLLQQPDVWNKIIRRSLFLDSGVRFPVRVWFEDLAAIPKLYQFTDKILYVPKAYHRYLQRRDSVTSTSKAMRNLEIIPAVDALWDFYRGCGRFDELKDELKYLAFHDEFLTSSVRANLADWRSGAQEELMRDFLQKVPDYRSNPYVRRSSRQHKLLAWLLLHRMRGCVHIIMKLNDLRKQKQY
ncbi:MAG: glycosyltransferase family 2 protein [Oscillospiraceae bacterium]|nr:glycosyltransferase family 2 protein [Oscillospiraceae bacterium]